MNDIHDKYKNYKKFYTPYYPRTPTPLPPSEFYSRCGVTFGLALKMVIDSTQQISAAIALISLNVNNRQDGREREGNGIRREEGGWVFVVVGGAKRGFHGAH